MSPLTFRATPSRERPGAAALWGVSLAVTALWALSGALLCAAVFAASLQPAPNPADASPGPIPAGGWGLVILVMIFPAVLLAASPLVVLISGLLWLHGNPSTRWRIRAAWVAAAAAGLAAEALFLGAVVLVIESAQPGHGAGLTWPRWGPPALSAGFLAAGAAMVAVLALAARAGSAAGTVRGV